MSTVLITGVTSGIGQALAREFSHLGHTVIGCGRNEGKISMLRNELGEANQFSVVDVRFAEQVDQWSKTILNRHSVDIVINNAGMKGELRPLWEASAADVARVIDTNINGTVNIIRSFVSQMASSRSGTIINMSSEWGRTADANVATYCASKFAIEGLTKSLAKELPKGMIAIALSPLIVWTELLEQCKELLLPGEYELGVSPECWARFAVPKMLALTEADSGTSLTWSPNFSVK
ncbi:SDR family oxidoreductase [Burkholderia cepacia]|uniref:SDR family oxidoreductase n=1 Tax=Burkholderia cepacia TaxID=292 RepID=UPI000AE753B2|nr:SDR family oxidoreductase [Burkholderia cepacia]